MVICLWCWTEKYNRWQARVSTGGWVSTSISHRGIQLQNWIISKVAKNSGHFFFARLFAVSNVTQGVLWRVKFGVTLTPMCVYKPCILQYFPELRWKKINRHVTQVGFQPMTFAILKQNVSPTWPLKLPITISSLLAASNIIHLTSIILNSILYQLILTGKKI